jgi:hypothetical protein
MTFFQNENMIKTHNICWCLTNSMAPEPKFSSLFLQEPATTSCPEPTGSSAPQPVSLRSTLILSFHLNLVLLSGLFSSGFTTKIFYTFLDSLMRATCPAHLTLLDLICLMTSGEEYKIQSSSLYNFFHTPVTSSFFGPYILSLESCSQTPLVYALPKETKFHTDTKQLAELWFCIF